MDSSERKRVEIAEVCRVEGHSAVSVEFENGRVIDVKLDVFEGTRFFEQIVLSHSFDEIPHITSRICAICSTGHVLAAIFAIERAFDFAPGARTSLLRELMHLGMIIESHATHICALALPDFLGTRDLLSFATDFPDEFSIWTRLRNLGAKVQTVIGGRPFHPVNLHPGKFSRDPQPEELNSLLFLLQKELHSAITLCEKLLTISLPLEHTYSSPFLALSCESDHYSYFGNDVRSSEGWTDTVQNYKSYLSERSTGYSHAKHSTAKDKIFMVGSLARLYFSAHKLSPTARALYQSSPLASGNQNTVLNNLAQSIELVDAIERSGQVIKKLLDPVCSESAEVGALYPRAASAVGAVECPRGTLYHSYSFDEKGRITAADMITPSAQNAARIEQDIRTVAQAYSREAPSEIETKLETLVRAYDPCNTCATHMVKVIYKT